MGTTTFSARRPALLVPPGFFFLLCLLVLVYAPDIGTRLFFLVMTLLAGLWFARCWRSAVVVSDGGVVLRGQLRSSRFAWEQIEVAETTRMTTGSPLAAWVPYVALQLQLVGGRVRTFPELAARQRSDRTMVQIVVQAINERNTGHRNS